MQYTRIFGNSVFTCTPVAMACGHGSKIGKGWGCFDSILFSSSVDGDEGRVGVVEVPDSSTGPPRQAATLAHSTKTLLLLLLQFAVGCCSGCFW